MQNVALWSASFIVLLAALVDTSSILANAQTEQLNPSLEKPLEGGDVRGAEHKRQWESNMRVWGKRSPLDGVEVKRAWNNDGGQLRVWGKRQWSGNDMRVWGKRAPLGVVGAGDKRKWSGNDMRVWGKRQWSDNSKSMRVWGKRSGWNTNVSHKMEKRGWDTRSIPVWGRR